MKIQKPTLIVGALAVYVLAMIGYQVYVKGTELKDLALSIGILVAILVCLWFVLRKKEEIHQRNLMDEQAKATGDDDDDIPEEMMK